MTSKSSNLGPGGRLHDLRDSASSAAVPFQSLTDGCGCGRGRGRRSVNSSRKPATAAIRFQQTRRDDTLMRHSKPPRFKGSAARERVGALRMPDSPSCANPPSSRCVAGVWRSTASRSISGCSPFSLVSGRRSLWPAVFWGANTAAKDSAPIADTTCGRRPITAPSAEGRRNWHCSLGDNAPATREALSPRARAHAISNPWTDGSLVAAMIVPGGPDRRHVHHVAIHLSDDDHVV